MFDDEFQQISITQPDITIGKLVAIMRVFDIDYSEFSMHRELYNTFYEMLKMLGGDAFDKFGLLMLLLKNKYLIMSKNRYDEIHKMIQKGELDKAEKMINRLLGK